MAQAPTAALSARLQSVRQRLIELQLDALVVIALPNILYLTNFSGSSAIVVVTADRLLFLTDSRYVTAVADMRGERAHECPGLELVEVEGSYDARVARLLNDARPTRNDVRVGVEAAHLTVSRLTWLEQHVDRRVELAQTQGIVERIRVVKDGYELTHAPAGGPTAVRRRGRGASGRPRGSDRARGCDGH